MRLLRVPGPPGTGAPHTGRGQTRERFELQLFQVSAAVSLLLSGVTLFLILRSVPSRIISRLKTVEDIASGASALVEKFNRERVERAAEFEAFADRCEELLATASNKQRRAAASASRAQKREEEQSQPLSEEDQLIALRRRAGLM